MTASSAPLSAPRRTDFSPSSTPASPRRRFPLLLLNYLSYFTGYLAHVNLPYPLSFWTVWLFAKAFKINVDEAAKPLHEYRSIGEFFSRDLKTSSRPIGEGFVSPVDGVLRDHGPIKGDTISQVKGIDYSLAQLLGSEEDAKRYQNGHYFTLYLAPPDYHCIHMPIDGSIVKTTYIPGYLWPVNNRALSRVKSLFAVSERVIAHTQSEHGSFAVVIVGATNVGRIRLTYVDRTFDNPSALLIEIINHPSTHLARGAKLGAFELGSSVIVLWQNPEQSATVAAKIGKIRTGMTVVNF